MSINKLINIGAISLLVYCIYNTRPLNTFSWPSGANYKGIHTYDVNIDINKNNPNRSLADKALTYIFANKLEEANLLSNKENRQLLEHQETETIAQGDKVSFLYTSDHGDGEEESGLIEEFLIQDDIISKILNGMKISEKKKASIEQNEKLPSFLKNKTSPKTITIEIKTLTKHKV